MPEVSTETDSQTRTRSALGGFERDAKTFEGHLQRITGSAEAFVKRCAKFAASNPDHPRLAETAELLAEAKRILGQGEPATPAEAIEAAAIEAGLLPRAFDTGKIEPKRGPETWQLATGLAGLTERVRQLEAEVFGEGDGGAVAAAMLDTPAEAELSGMDPSAAERIAGLPDATIALSFTPSTPSAGTLADPAAEARVQAALDAAAAKRAEAEAAERAPVPANPFATLAPASSVNPFAGIGTK